MQTHTHTHTLSHTHVHRQSLLRGSFRRKYEQKSLQLHHNSKCSVPLGPVPWEIQVAFPRKSQLQQLCYPTYGAHWVFMCFHYPPNSGMDCRSFNMRTNVNACDCEHKCIDTTRESALKVDCRRKIPGHTGESNLHQQCAGLMLYQLRDIPIPTYKWS